MIDDKLSFIDLIKHTLLDSYEFSAHSENELEGIYTLNMVGIDFMVGFDDEKAFRDLNEKKCKKVIFAHTHPLGNDEYLKFIQDRPDPRKLIAYGMKLLPLGNFPTKGDIEYFQKLKQKAESFNIKIMGVVFSARGIWIFDIKEKLFLKEEKNIKTKDPNSEGFGDFVDYLNLKLKYPSYFMEIQQPKIKTKITYNFRIKVNSLIIIWMIIKEFFYKTFLKIKINNIIKKFYNQGVILNFINYKSKKIDPVSLMRKTIEEWEEKYLL
ncbi:MAG: hypothetical protein EXS49_02035 [Candidatus Pacebacteria bacterium]|nr:hypothetical protein [Candidatus Paceibacterota bacterium]